MEWSGIGDQAAPLPWTPRSRPGFPLQNRRAPPGNTNKYFKSPNARHARGCAARSLARLVPRRCRTWPRNALPARSSVPSRQSLAIKSCRPDSLRTQTLQNPPAVMDVHVQCQLARRVAKHGARGRWERDAPGLLVGCHSSQTCVTRSTTGLVCHMCRWTAAKRAPKCQALLSSSSRGPAYALKRRPGHARIAAPTSRRAGRCMHGRLFQSCRFFHAQQLTQNVQLNESQRAWLARRGRAFETLRHVCRPTASLRGSASAIEARRSSAHAISRGIAHWLVIGL